MKNKMPLAPDFILIKSGSQTHKIKTGDIFYLQKNGNYLTVVTKEKKILIRENMMDVFEIIPAQDFIRVHKSYIVALQHISTIEIHQLTVGNYKVPVGASYRDEINNRLKL